MQIQRHNKDKCLMDKHALTGGDEPQEEVIILSMIFPQHFVYLSDSICSPDLCSSVAGREPTYFVAPDHVIFHITDFCF